MSTTYTEIMRTDSTRPYRKRKRARSEAETRRRITEAVVELHRTVGPARTTVTDVAERAGVSRMTVYKHFPAEADLIEACSTHWSARNPPPAPSSWSGVPPGPERLRAALATMYQWYRDTEDMMGKILRDAPIVTPLGELMEARWEPYVEEIVRRIAAGWPPRADRRARQASPAPTRQASPAPTASVPTPEEPGAGHSAGRGRPMPDTLAAAVRLAIDFRTWQLLVRSGLSDADAAALAARMAESAELA